MDIRRPRPSFRLGSKVLLAGLLLFAFCHAAPAAAQIGDPYGEQTYPRSMALAERLAGTEPATDWETILDGEAADLMEFIGDDLLLVGVVEVDRNASPKHGRLYLYDLASGERRWRVGRRDVGTGGYELTTTEPWIVLRGSDGEETRLTALDPTSGDRKWELEMDEPSSLAVLTGLERVLVLDRRDDAARLRAIRLSDGRESWSARVPGGLVADNTPASLLVTDERVLLVGRGLAVVDTEAGSIGPSLRLPPLAADDGSVQPLGGGILAWDDAALALAEPGVGRIRWTWEAGAGIQTVSGVDGDALVVAGPEGAPRLTRLGASEGVEVWSRPLGAILTGPVAPAEGLVVIPTESALIGLDAGTGVERFRTDLPEDAVTGSPSRVEFVGMPDVVRAEGGTLFLARERAGLLSFALPGGELRWFRPHHEPSGSLGRYTGEARWAYVFEAEAMRDGGLPELLEPPSGLGIGSGSSSLLAAAQRDYDAARARYDGLESGASGAERASAASGVRTAAELGIAAAQVDAAVGRIAATAELAQAIGRIHQAIRAYNIGRGRQGLVDRAELSMRSTLLMQQRLFQSGFYVRPYVMVGTGRGASLVRLGSGLRADPVFSPVNGPSVGYGLDLGIVRISPSGERMAVVGISLDTRAWERRDKWNTHVPEMSLLTYRLAELDFDEQPRYPYALAKVLLQGAEAVRQALAAGADPDGTPFNPPLHTAVALEKPEIVRMLLEAGADPNALDASGSTPIQQTLDPEMREILFDAGAEENNRGGPNVQTFLNPVFLAVQTQDPQGVRQAVADGADPNMDIGSGQSILYLAVMLDNVDVVRVLLELGASTEWEDDNGDSPLDIAGSDAVRELLRGG